MMAAMLLKMSVESIQRELPQCKKLNLEFADTFVMSIKNLSFQFRSGHSFAMTALIIKF